MKIAENIVELIGSTPPLPNRARLLILTSLFILFFGMAFATRAFAQEDNKMALSAGSEWNMNSFRYFAGAAVLGFDYNLFSSFAAGISAAASFKSTGFTAIESAAMFRWYFGEKNNLRFFAQADAGVFIYMENDQTIPLFLGGARAGFRLPLDHTFYFEPYARAGYPFAFGVGVTAGVRFVTANKRPNEIIVEDINEKIAEEIVEDIERLNIPDVSVQVEDEGVTISMDNIQFEADAAVMQPGEREKLDKVIEILRRYPDRVILVSGHAALIGTVEEQKQISTERAAVVANYLVEQKVISPDRVIVRGEGASRPLGDNNTEEGRRKNRRVEITLLENKAGEQ